MLRGQLSIGFMSRTAVGFILVISLAYAVLSINDSFKKREQEQTIINAARYVATELLNSMEELDSNHTLNKTIRLPVFRAETVAPYKVSFEDRNGEVFVRADSLQWNMVARSPLYLNSSYAQVTTRPTYPPKMCVQIKREDENYRINITC